MTGSLLVFHEELDAWRFPAVFRARPTLAGRLSGDMLWAAARRAYPAGIITAWALPGRPDRTDTLFLIFAGGREHLALHLDPYTGEARGEPFDHDRTLNGWLFRLHYTFLAGPVGTLAAGLLAVGLLLLGLSGLYLYRRFWQSFLTLRWGRSARIFFSDLHKTVGIASTGFNLVLGFTGAWWNLGRVYSDWTAPASSVAAVAPAAPAPGFDFAPDGLSFDALLARAGQALPGFRLRYLRLPAAATGTLTLYGTVLTANPLRGDEGSRLLFDAGSGTLKEVVDIRRVGRWEKILDGFERLHFGTFGDVYGRGWDLPVKLVWAALGLSPGVLAVSGFVIWRACRPGASLRQRTDGA